MFNIIFPENTGQRYYSIHFQYLLDIFQYLGCNISFQHRTDLIVTINRKDFLFDYWDTSEVRKSDLPTFKFHTKIEDLDKVIPFSPVSFYDWSEYYKLERQICYKPKNILISFRQRPYAGALERRNVVLQLLMNKSDFNVLHHIIEQEEYWKEINNIGTAVFVPGFCNNMLDRGHMQYMAFGCCTISPNLPEVLPFNKPLIDGEHYIRCADDYSDLIPILERHRMSSDVKIYSYIGNTAKQLFKQTSTPESLGEWIRQHL